MEEKRDVELRLADSLKKMVQTEPFEKITIKQITDGAGVIRVTFYHHFQDKYDLLEWIMRTEILDPVRILMDNGMYKEAIILIFSSIEKEKSFYQRVAKMEGQNSFEEIVLRSIRKLLGGLFQEAAEENTKRSERHRWLTPEYLAEYYADSMTFVTMYWIRSGMTIPPEEVATIYEYIAKRSMIDVLTELKGV